MLFLLFRVGDQRYVIDAAQIVEVLPLVTLTPVPHAPAGVSGVIDFRGVPVPVVDVSLRLQGRAAPARLSTRVVIVRDERDDGHGQPFGVIAEQATEVIRRDSAEFQPSGLSPADASFLVGVAADADGVLHHLRVTALLADVVHGHEPGGGHASR